MSATTTFTVTPQAVVHALQLTAEAALRSVRVDADAEWLEVVPVEEGLLEASYRSTVKRGKRPTLLLSAGGPGAGFSDFAEPGRSRLLAIIRRKMPAKVKEPGAYYAYWVETGWTARNGRKVPGQYPLTKTAFLAASLLPGRMADEARKRGLGEGRDR